LFASIPLPSEQYRDTPFRFKEAYTGGSGMLDRLPQSQHRLSFHPCFISSRCATAHREAAEHISKLFDVACDMSAVMWFDPSVSDHTGIRNEARASLQYSWAYLIVLG